MKISMYSLYFFAHFKFPWEYSLLNFHGNSWWRLEFIMRILFDVNVISILVLSGMLSQAGTMEQLIHCFCALEQITQVVWEQLRRTMPMKTFRLNKHENYGKVLTYFDLFVLYLAVRSLNCILNQNSYSFVSPFKDFQIKVIYTLCILMLISPSLRHW